METLAILTLGTFFTFLFGLLLYCAGAVLIEVLATPLSLAEDIIDHRKKNSSE